MFQENVRLQNEFHHSVHYFKKNIRTIKQKEYINVNYERISGSEVNNDKNYLDIHKIK